MNVKLSGKLGQKWTKYVGKRFCVYGGGPLSCLLLGSENFLHSRKPTWKPKKGPMKTTVLLKGDYVVAMLVWGSVSVWFNGFWTITLPASWVQVLLQDDEGPCSAPNPKPDTLDPL